MSQNKHTPGPWKARKVEGPGWPGQQGWHIDYNDYQEQVTDFVYEEADAHLIAAAPDLLEALELLIAETDPLNLNTGEPWCRVRAAIRKARGEQP